MNIIKNSCIKGTKEGEYHRSIEMFKEIYERDGFYFAMAFLMDSGYDREDIAKMLVVELHDQNLKINN